jgi:CDP-4-dehydro-6-deoxyglucose reductase
MNYLTLSRAARLAGITRAELQRRIRRGDIETFEGSVAVSDLLRLYPEVSLSNDEALDRVERIKSAALPRSHDAEAVLPNAQVLVSRLKSLSETLVARITELNAANAVLEEVQARLAGLAEAATPAPHALAELRDWLARARTDLAAAAPADGQAQLFAKDTFLRLMAANVKLIPSGHDFFVEGSESILDASVRAGLKLSYGCSSGNCGSCKARLLSGEVWKLREHDYVLSEREKQMGYLLTCCNTAVTDVVIEAAEAATVADLPRQEIRASLRKQERIAPNLIALNVQTPRTQTLRFMAGQRARLTLENGASVELPIASCPCNGRNLWFYVRESEADFARTVFAGLHPGHLIQVEGPRGDFVLREDAPEPAVFVAIGDGISPVKSLIEHAVSIDLIESFHLYWASDYPEGHYQGKWGRALTDALDNFQFTPLLCADPGDLMAVIAADQLQLGEARFYLAGPMPAIGAVREALLAAGVAPGRLCLEVTAT